MSNENKEKKFKEKLDKLSEELGIDTPNEDICKAIDMLSEELISVITIKYEEINKEFTFKVKPIDLSTQIKMETIQFPTQAEKDRFIVHQCVIEPKLTPSVINKMPKGMVTSIVVFANSLAFFHQTRVQLSSLQEALSENMSGKFVKP